MSDRVSLSASERLAAADAELNGARATHAEAARALREAHQAWKEAHMVVHPEAWITVRLVRAPLVIEDGYEL